MNLFDLLTNRNKTIDYSKNMPPLEAVQLNNDGSVNNNPILGDDKPVTAYDKLANRTKQAGNILFNRLFGEQSQPTDYVDTSSDVINAGVSDNPRVGGLIPDVMSGFRENASTPFNVNNFGQNKLDDGRDKGFAYRLGEGLGTAGRFLSSELGRGLLTAGAVGLGGGSGLEALAYGTQAGALNNRLRNEDKIYRNAMIEQAQNSLRNNPEFNSLSDEEKQAIINQMVTDKQIKDVNNLTDIEKQALQNAFNDRLRFNQQSQLDDVANRINNMRGYVTQGVYNNMLKSQQLQDNAAYRKMYYDNQLENQRAMQQFRQDQLKYNKIKDAQDRAFRQQQLASDNAYRNANLDLGYANLEEKRQARMGKNQAQNKIDKSLTENMQTLADIDAGLQLIKENPGAYSWLKGKIGADLANRIDPKGVKTRTQIDNITAIYRKWLTGAQMSDQERKAYERFLPAPTDNANIVINKLQGMKDSIERKNQIIMQQANSMVDNDPLGLGL